MGNEGWFGMGAGWPGSEGDTDIVGLHTSVLKDNSLRQTDHSLNIGCS